MNRYFDNLIVRQGFSVPRQGLSQNQRDFILDDQKRGMTALETVRYWPFDQAVSLSEVKRIRGEK